MLGFLFVLSCGRAVAFVAKVDGDVKDALVVGAFRLYKLVAGNVLAFFLEGFLQEAFVVAAGLVFLDAPDCGNDEAQDVFFGGLVAGIKVVGADDGLHAVGQNRGLCPASAHFLAFSQNQHFVDAVFKRNLPSNDYETSQMIVNLDGIVDRELLASQLSFVKDASETIEIAEKEDSEAIKDDDYNANEFGNNVDESEEDVNK